MVPPLSLTDLLIRHQVYHWMRALRIELRAIRIFQSGDIVVRIRSPRIAYPDRGREKGIWCSRA